LLNLRIRRDVYLDGLWQNEGYFKDAEDVIRQDLAIKPPNDPPNRSVAAQIESCHCPVALHVRWFDDPHASSQRHNVSVDYYERALARVRAEIEKPHFFLFSDNPSAATARLPLMKDSCTVVAHNVGLENAYADLWLMNKCRHFIMANSTFSWWGAWLSSPHAGKLVIAPDPARFDERHAWRRVNLLLNTWVRL
jgi:hypothetical protein